jgi:hypothetical protein
MSSIFPPNPSPGDHFTVGTTTYMWTGYAWIKTSSGSGTFANLTVTTVLIITDPIASTSTNTGALQVAGGVGIGQDLYVGTTATILGTRVSTSTTTGALTVVGGVGIGGSVNIGGGLTVNGVITGTITTATTVNNTGGVSSANTFYVQFVANNTTSSQTPNTTSALNFKPSTGDLFATTFNGSGANLTSIPNNALVHSSITINSGTGISVVGSPVSLGSAVTINNTGVLSFSAGTTGFQPSTATTGAITLTGTLGYANGGTSATTIGSSGTVVYSDGSKYNFSSTGTAGNVLVSGGTGSPVFQNTLTLAALTVNTGTFTGPVTFGGNVTFNGTATYVYSTNDYFTDNMIELHMPPGGVGNTWSSDDGKDIGLRFHYYNRTSNADANAALVLADDSQTLEWYITGSEYASGVFSGTVSYGTFKTGAIKLVGGTGTNSATTGDLTVAGGVGVAGGVFVSGAVTATNIVSLGDVSISGNLTLNSTALIMNDPGISVGTGYTTIDSFSTSSYRSAKYIISISNTTTKQFQTSDVLLIHNGVNSYIESTSVYSSSTSIMTFATSVSTSSGVILQAAGVASGNTVKVQKFYITI